MGVLGIKLIMLNCMFQKRKYFNGKKRPSEFWWIFMIILVVLILIFPIIMKIFALYILLLILLTLVSLMTVILIYMNFSDIEKRYINQNMSRDAFKLSKKLKKRFTPSVLAERLKFGISTSYGVMLPSITLWISKDLDIGTLFVENLGAFEKLERSKIIESVSGILPFPYECVSSSLVQGGDFVRFEFEDTQTSHKFIVKNRDLKPFMSDDVHSIRLADDLVWNSKKVPHGSVIGRTNSGKSTFIGSYMAEIAFLQGWKVIYASVKPDRYTKRFNGPTELDSIVQVAENLVVVMKKRLSKIQEMNCDDYTEISSMNDIVFFIDEIGSLNAMLDSDKKLKVRFENAMKSLSFTSRSSGIHLIGISQFGTIEAFFGSSIRGNMKDFVVMLGSAASSGEERRFMIPGYNDLPNRNYEIGQGIVTVLYAGNKWATPHYFETPLIDSY